MHSRTAAPMTVQSPRKGETSSASMWNGLRSPTHALSPRQLPTDHDHAVSTRAYQSDQSSRLHLGCHRPCCPKQTTLQAHQQERVPATPPVESTYRCQNGAHRQGFASPRQNRAPLPAPRRSGQPDPATGGSGGNTSTSAWSKKERPACLLAEPSRSNFRTLNRQV